MRIVMYRIFRAHHDDRMPSMLFFQRHVPRIFCRDTQLYTSDVLYRYDTSYRCPRRQVCSSPSTICGCPRDEDVGPTADVVVQRHSHVW